MRFFNRTTEVGLNILQLLYSQKKVKQMWTLKEICERLKESELFAYRVITDLRQKGYIYSIRGAQGGYQLYPHTENTDLKSYLEQFNREYRPSVILNTEAASEYANQIITKFLYKTKLVDVFNAGVTKPFLSIPWPTPPDNPPKGAA